VPGLSPGDVAPHQDMAVQVIRPRGQCDGEGSVGCDVGDGGGGGDVGDGEGYGDVGDGGGGGDVGDGGGDGGNGGGDVNIFACDHMSAGQVWAPGLPVVQEEPPHGQEVPRVQAGHGGQGHHAGEDGRETLQEQNRKRRSHH